MKEYYYNVAVINDEDGLRVDFDPVYSPPLVYTFVVGDVIPESATSVVVAAQVAGVSEDIAAQILEYWNATFTFVGEKELEPEPEVLPPSRKVPLPIEKAVEDTDEIFLEKVLTFTKDAAIVEVARLDNLKKVEPIILK
jgi:hypothetical protein